MTNTQPIFGIQSLLVRLEIGGTLVSALIDSGAGISVVRSSTLTTLTEVHRFSMAKPDVCGSAVNGTPLSFVGQVRLPCRWSRNETEFWETFYVVPEMSVPFILGFDLLHRQSCAIDFSLGLLDVGSFVLECVSPVLSVSATASSVASVCVNCDAVVPPRSDTFVPCKLQWPCSTTFSSVDPSSHILIELNTAFESPVFVAAVRDNGLFVQVLNPSQTGVPLYTNQIVATGSVFNGAFSVSSCVPCYDKRSSFHSLFASDLSTLSESEARTASELLKEFSSIFSVDKWDLGNCDLHKLHIPLQEGTLPVRVPYRSMNPTKRRALKEHVDNLLSHDLIEPTHSEWASPTVLVPKKDGFFRRKLSVLQP